MIRLKFLGCIALLLMAASCSNTNENLKKIIPVDATGVVSIDVPAILESADMFEGSDIVIPAALKSIVDENDDAPLCKFITDLPIMGYDTDGKIFVFFTAKTFASVLLVPLDDEQMAMNALERRTGNSFNEVAGLKCIYNEENFYAVHDNVLFYGIVSRPVDAVKASKAAGAMLSRNATNILENSEANACLDKDDEINVYMKLDGLRTLMAKNKTYQEIAQKMPLIEIFTQSDIKFITCDVNIDDKNVNMTAKFNADANSDYAQLLDMTLSKPSPECLKAIPNSMDYIITMSVKGGNFVKLPQIQQLIQTFTKLPYLGSLNIASILSNVDGPFTVGLARDPNLEGVWNAVLAARSTNPQVIVNGISSFATAMGQAPEIYDNEYIYQYENKMVKMGTVGNVVYLKMLNYDQNEGNVYDNPAIRDFFTKSPMGLWVQIHDNSVGGNFNFGFSDKFNATGAYIPREGDSNAAMALLQVLCSVKPPRPFDDAGVTDMSFLGPNDHIQPVN